MDTDRTQRRISGFSLIEVMTAIFIVGILIVIVIPHYQEMRFKADEQRAMANLTFMFNAQKQYYIDQRITAERPEELWFEAYTTDAAELQKYVDFTTDDGVWMYGIQSAGDNWFVLVADHQLLTGRSIEMDETGEFTFSY